MDANEQQTIAIVRHGVAAHLDLAVKAVAGMIGTSRSCRRRRRTSGGEAGVDRGDDQAEADRGKHQAMTAGAGFGCFVPLTDDEERRRESSPRSRRSPRPRGRPASRGAGRGCGARSIRDARATADRERRPAARRRGRRFACDQDDGEDRHAEGGEKERRRAAARSRSLRGLKRADAEEQQADARADERQHEDGRCSREALTAVAFHERLFRRHRRSVRSSP